MERFLDEFRQVIGINPMYVLTVAYLTYAAFTLKRDVPRWKQLTVSRKQNVFLTVLGSLLFLFLSIVFLIKGKSQ